MTGELVCAGHPPAILTREGVPNPLTLYAEGPVLGIIEGFQFYIYRFEFAPGDRIYLYTDGVLDASRFSRDTMRRERFGLKGLKNLLQQAATKPLTESVKSVWESVLAHCRERPSDDMTLVGIEVPEPSTFQWLSKPA